MQVVDQVLARSWLWRRVALPTVGAVVTTYLCELRNLALHRLPFAALGPEARFKYDGRCADATARQRQTATNRIDGNELSWVRHVLLLVLHPVARMEATCGFCLSAWRVSNSEIDNLADLCPGRGAAG